MEQEASITLSRTTSDGCARAAALAAAAAVACRPAPVVAYESAGTLAVIGAEVEALSAADSLGDAVDCTLVVTEPTDRGSSTGDKGKSGKLIYAPVARIHGYLGRFEVMLAGPNGPVGLGAVTAGRRWVDLVLDLTTPGFISSALPPVGYYAPARNPTELARALAEIPELVGRFERPEFFDYDPGLRPRTERDQGLHPLSRCLSRRRHRLVRRTGRARSQSVSGRRKLHYGLSHRRHHLRLSPARRYPGAAAGRSTGVSGGRRRAACGPVP